MKHHDATSLTALGHKVFAWIQPDGSWWIIGATSRGGHPARTSGDHVVWLPAQRVLFTGDLLFHLVIPLVFAGSVQAPSALSDAR